MNVVAELRPGSRLGGCEVTAALGEGGMAVVYRATQLGLDRPVALKVMGSDYASRPENRERFMRSVRILGSIDHPNVIPVHTGGEEDRHLFMVMKLVQGKDLHELLTRSGRLDPAVAIEVVSQLAAALDVAHAKQVVHRDVKPGNVLVEEATSHIYLTDFDLAKAVMDEGLTRSTHTFFTARYSAPERFRGGPDGDTGTVRGDVYSLGLILLEVLAGLDRPALPDDVPAALSDVIEKATSLNPADRHASAGELAEDARRAFDTHKQMPKPESLRVSRSVRHNPFPEPISVGLSERVSRLCDEIVQRLDDPDLRQRVIEVRRELGEPLRVGVAGRVSAGKSTLVNALLSRRIAQTDLGETTRVVTWYRHVEQSGPNSSERIEVHLRSGERVERSFRVDGTMPTTFERIPLEEIAEVHVWLQLDAVKSLTIIDTPGLASLTPGASERAMEVIAAEHRASDKDQDRAIGQAQALLFVLSGDAREDDEEALRRFQARFKKGASAVNAIGVLTKVDKAGLGEQTGASAIKKANRIREALGPLVSAVVPVIGLLAEAADAGTLNEDHARALELLAAAGQIESFSSFDSFEEIDAPVSRSDRRELYDLLQAYGLTEAYKLHEIGQLSGTNLVRRMREVSGIAELHRQLAGFDQRADALKAEAALSQLDRLSWRDSRLRFIRAEVDQVRREESMQVLELFAALDRCAVNEVELPPDMLAELERMVTARSIAARLGVADETDTIELERRAQQRQQAWNAFYVSPSTGLAAASVASPMVQAYGILVEQTRKAMMRGAA